MTKHISNFIVRIETEHELSSEQKLHLLDIFRRRVENIVPDDMKVTMMSQPTNEEIMQSIRDGENKRMGKDLST